MVNELQLKTNILRELEFESWQSQSSIILYLPFSQTLNYTFLVKTGGLTFFFLKKQILLIIGSPLKTNRGRWFRRVNLRQRNTWEHNVVLHLCALSCHIAYYKTVQEPCIKLRLQIKLYHKFSTIFTIVKQWFHAFLLRPHSIKECRLLWLCESVSEFMKLFYYSFYSFMQCVWLEHSLCFHRFVVAEFIRIEPIVVLFDGENCSLLTPFTVFSLKRIWHWYDVILMNIERYILNRTWFGSSSRYDI